jgi:cobalt/nickel transport system permease protein
MHVHFLDPYAARRSLIHSLDPRVKLVLAVAFILTTSLVPFGIWPVYILLLAIILSIEVLSELGIGYVQKRASLALPFILAALPLLFTTQGIPLFSFVLLRWEGSISLQGLERFVSIAVKSWLSMQAAILLASSTPFPDLLAAMRAVKVPRLLVAIFGLMWRYLFVLADEAVRLIRARAARSSDHGLTGIRPGRDIVWRARVVGGMAGSLLLRAFERSDRIYMAMLARGYDGEVRSTPLPDMQSHHRLFLIAGLAILGILLCLAYIL